MLYFARAFCYTKNMNDYVLAVKSKCASRVERYKELVALTEAPEIIADNRLWRKYTAEKIALERSVLLYYDLDAAIVLDLNEEASDLAEELAVELLERSDVDSENALIELYAHDKPSEILAEDMLGMYTAYAKDTLRYNADTDVERTYDGVKYCAITVRGNGAYFKLKGEIGLHRSSDGGAVTVTVIPVPTEYDSAIDPKDIRTDIFHATGAGGQNINKVATAVRLTHLPTGMTVVCRDERSQLRNRERAYETLVAKIEAAEREKLSSEKTRLRRGSAAEAKTKRVRIYDRKTDTLTDTRSNLSVPLKSALEGDIAKLINSVILTQND